jgi:hypothetical protein
VPVCVKQQIMHPYGAVTLAKISARAAHARLSAARTHTDLAVVLWSDPATRRSQASTAACLAVSRTACGAIWSVAAFCQHCQRSAHRLLNDGPAGASLCTLSSASSQNHAHDLQRTVGRRSRRVNTRRAILLAGRIRSSTHICIWPTPSLSRNTPR